MVRTTALLVLAVAAGAALYPGHEDVPSYGALAACLEMPALTQSACLRGVVRKLLDVDGARDVQGRIREQYGSNRCHEINHAVGIELYNRASSVEDAIGQCTESCFSSCAHGVVQGALLAVPGITASADELAHPDFDLLVTEGRKLCADPDSCHSVGHIAYLLAQDLTKALSLCDELAEGREPVMCYRGLFMEMMQENAAEDGADRYRDPEDLSSPCLDVPATYSRACFHFLHINQDATFLERGISDSREKQRLRKESCERIASDWIRASCFEGYGFSFSFATLVGPEIAREACVSLTSAADRAACLFGRAYAFSADATTLGRGFSFCASVEERIPQETCYQSIFDSAEARKLGDMERLCDAVPDPACKAALRAYVEGRTLRYDPRAQP